MQSGCLRVSLQAERANEVVHETLIVRLGAAYLWDRAAPSSMMRSGTRPDPGVQHCRITAPKQRRRDQGLLVTVVAIQTRRHDAECCTAAATLNAGIPVSGRCGMEWTTSPGPSRNPRPPRCRSVPASAPGTGCHTTGRRIRAVPAAPHVAPVPRCDRRPVPGSGPPGGWCSAGER